MSSSEKDQQKIDLLADSITPDLATWHKDPDMLKKFEVWQKKKALSPSESRDAIDG